MNHYTDPADEPPANTDHGDETRIARISRDSADDALGCAVWLSTGDLAALGVRPDHDRLRVAVDPDAGAVRIAPDDHADTCGDQQ